MKYMKTKTLILIIILPVIIVSSTVVIISYSINSAIKENRQIDTTDDGTTIWYTGETPGYRVEGMSKFAKYIVIGRVKSTTSTVDKDEVHSSIKVFSDIVIEVERELTGTYDGKEITFRTLGGMVANIKADTAPSSLLKEGDRIVVFLADKEPGSIWGDNYYVMGLTEGLYKIINGKAYGNEYPDGIDEQELVQKIIESRRR